MKKCATKDCSHGAKYIPKICVPAKGWAIDTHEPLSCLMGIEVCESCFKDMTPDMFFGPEVSKEPNNMRRVFEIGAAGKCPPDFERAFIERVLISSKEYEKYKRLTEAREDKGTLH